MKTYLTSDQQSLADYMSEISERCYYAGWMHNLEYVLWDALSTGPRKFGQDEITESDIQTLKKLSSASGCWITFHEETEETAIDLTDWTDKFRPAVNNDPEILKG